jgi:alkaline phosphatase
MRRRYNAEIFLSGKKVNFTFLIKIQTMKSLLSFFIFILSILNIQAQTQDVKGHSHNDYAQKHPLKTAFDAQMGAIEADVFLVQNDLYVAHEAKDIKPNNTLENLYLKPIAELVQTDKTYPFILLIDVKTQADSTLEKVIAQISRYSAFLKENCPIKFVISGNRPQSEKWLTLPLFIQFDGRPTENYTPEQWQHVGMVSESFSKYTSEKGQKNINQETFNKMKTVVEYLHKQGKKVRFWATPDKKKVWNALAKMGVDFINTDKPKALRGFLDKL